MLVLLYWAYKHVETVNAIVRRSDAGASSILRGVGDCHVGLPPPRNDNGYRVAVIYAIMFGFGLIESVFVCGVEEGDDIFGGDAELDVVDVVEDVSAAGF